MVNRTFSTQSNRFSYTGEQIKRITREEVITLRAVDAGKPGGGFMIKTLSVCVREIKDFFTSPRGAKKDRFCKHYGHIILGAWQSCYPNCGDCGVKITSPDQLRKAAPRA